MSVDAFAFLVDCDLKHYVLFALPGMWCSSKGPPFGSVANYAILLAASEAKRFWQGGVASPMPNHSIFSTSLGTAYGEVVLLFFFCVCVCFFVCLFVFFFGGGGGGLRSPAISLGFTTFGWDFCVYDRFFNPTIKVVTFRLRGWCVLGVFCCRHSPD